MINTIELGKLIRNVRKSQRVTQKDLALTAGTGLRFISDLENGKASCEFGKVLVVLHTLGIGLKFETPPVVQHE
jgi:HTH-type transcriptional regulator/antitoxin HipB